MILNRDEYMTRIRDRIGESTEDADIAFMEDMTDTYDDLLGKITDNTDWKQKYEENDAEWRRKYIDRFDGRVQEDPNIEIGDLTAENTVTEYDDLFKVVE